ncbi:hypothetical protein B4107_3592 [Bacillus safensis]|nr:hypothetical protein B4107_3592 [Bacillus safensis]
MVKTKCKCFLLQIGKPPSQQKTTFFYFESWYTSYHIVPFTAKKGYFLTIFLPLNLRSSGN